MNISNLLEQLNLDSVKEGGPTVVVFKVGTILTAESESESESEESGYEEEEEVTAKKVGKQYSVPSKHIVISSKKPVSKLANTFVEDDDVCTFCSMYGKSQCCLHHKKSDRRPWLTYRNAVEKGLTLQYEGLVFKAVPSSEPGKFILKVDGKVDVIKK